MKKFFIASVLSLCTFLAACGGEEPSGQEESIAEKNTETKELIIDSSSTFDILSEAEELFRFSQGNTQEAEPQENTSQGNDSQEEGLLERVPQPFFQFLGMQYYHGEPVQLWMEILDAEGNSLTFPGFSSHKLNDDINSPYIMDEVTANIYLLRADQSMELLVEGLPSNDPHPAYNNFFQEEGGESANRMHDYTEYSSWYVDRNGSCYCWWKLLDGTDGSYTFQKIDAAGNIIFDVMLGKNIRVSDIIELPDSTTYAVIHDSLQNITKLKGFDPDTGKLSEKDIPILNESGQPFTSNMSFTFGVSEEGTVYVLMWNGIFQLNLTDGTLSAVLPFTGTSYTTGDSSIDMTAVGWVRAAVCGFEDGSAEILWYNDYLANVGDIGSVGIAERLRPADMERTPVTIRGYAFSSWMKRQATRFNRSSDTWQIVLEEYASSNAVDAEEYARLTSIQIATGGGPDMIYGDFMEDYIYGMTEKGALADLAPLLAESGIRQEDYLSFVFDVWRDDEHVYGITPQLDSSYLYTIDASALEGSGEPDVEALADALLAWEENAAFDTYIKPESILRWFLQGSDTLWGMVDREGGSCDFSGELFVKLLETAKRYGNASARNYHNLVRVTDLTDFYQYDSNAELEAAGRTVCGILFDDGCYGTVNSGSTLALNTSSQSQEGAWEFLSFLLEDTTQAKPSSFPVKRSLLSAWVTEQAARVMGHETSITVTGSTYLDYGEQVKVNKTYTSADITLDRIMEYMSALENIRALPSRNAPLLEIICEEAADYFNGIKSAADTAKVIENRVQLYLDERR